MRYYVKMKNQSGITLTALVITIIVMAILVGATIFNISAKEGVINQTRYAVDEADEKAIIDDVQIVVTKLAAQWDGNGTIQWYIINKIRAKGENGYKTENEGTIKIDRAGVITYLDKANNEIVFDDGAKKLKVNKDGKVEVAIYTESDIDNLQVGDTVTYVPSGTYTWRAEYSSSDLTPSTDDVVLSSASGQSFQVTSWKVLSIDEPNGKVELISISPTSGTVRLQGAQGYNNGVKMLNDACDSLYGNGSTIKGRSINIGDIEDRMTDEALSIAHSYANASVYGNKMENAYTENKYYPLIYAKEVKSVINGNENTRGFNLSSQENLFSRTENIQELQLDGYKSNLKTGLNGMVDATTSIQPYQTYWYKNNAFMQTAFKAPVGLNETDGTINTNYNLLMKNDSENVVSYYLASRCCVNASSTRCGFYLRRCRWWRYRSILYFFL